MERLRRRVANVLVRVAYRLDPTRPKATSRPDGGYNITFQRVPMAQVHFNDGEVRSPTIVDMRPTHDPRDFAADLDEGPFTEPPV
jgi:hypothetical protein